MAEEKELTGWERSRAAQKGYGNFYTGLAIATVFIAGVWIGSRIFATKADPSSSAFFLNMWTEALGILVTVGLFGLISQWLAERRYKRQLVDEAASLSNEITKHAIHMMRRRGWLDGSHGLLIGANLSFADLEKVPLSTANLYKAELDLTNLEHANLNGACLRNGKLRATRLRGASLLLSDLRGAVLEFADLRDTSLLATNFQDADLRGAGLQGSNLSDANLQNANLEYVSFDETTKLPDKSYWDKSTDMKRFTDRDHPTYWRSNLEASPANYKGADRWLELQQVFRGNVERKVDASIETEL